MLGKWRGLCILAAVAVLAALLVQSSVPAETLEEKVKKFELKNGMKFLVIERREAPVAFCAIVFNVGSANEWPNVTGISHLLEHMMFKGSRMMGTTNYKKEIPYIEKTDEFGEKTIELRKKIDEWRFEKFRCFANDVIAGFSEEERERVGANRYEQNRLVVEKVRAMKTLPDSLTSIKYMVRDEDVDYLDLFLEHELAWGEVAKLLDEQRRYIRKDELWETYMNNGSRFLNAGTSEDWTVYFVYLPSNRIELWMTMESDRIDTPVFREFWSERDVVMEERRLGENDPDDVLSEAFNSVAFTACPYKWPVVGWMSDILTIDRKEIEAYHRKFYAPNNAVAILVGDVDYKKVRKMAKKYFGSIPAQEQPDPVETREPEQQGERRVVIEHDANPKLMIGWHKPTFPHPDAITFMVLQDILSGGRTSRLYRTIYEQKELVGKPAYAYSGPGMRYDNLFIISAEPRHPHTLEEVEQAIYDEIEKIKTDPVTDRELQRIKNQIDAQQIRQLGSNLGIAFQTLMGELYLGDYRDIFKMYDRIKEVTADDVMRIANEYLIWKNRTVAFRVQKEKEEGEKEAGEEEIDRQILMQYIMSLGPEVAQEVQKKFMSMKSEKDAMEYARELWEHAKDAGFVKDEK